MQTVCAEFENGKIALERPSEEHWCLFTKPGCVVAEHTVEAGELTFRLDMDGLCNFSLYCCAEHIFDFLNRIETVTPSDFRLFHIGEEKKLMYDSSVSLDKDMQGLPCIACEKEFSNGDSCYTFFKTGSGNSLKPGVGIHEDCSSVFGNALNDVRDAAAEHPQELLPKLL